MEENAKHSRGPWSVIESTHKLGTTYGILDPDVVFIAQCHPKNGLKSEMGEVRANANLMAAAPEMLEVLETTLGNIRSIKATHPGVTTYDVWEKVVAEVVAKAKGGRP
jgi:hypothetical protein